MKVSIDALIAALLHPALYLMGNEDGGVELHCRDHFDGGRPLACYDRSGSGHPDPAVAWVATVPSLWAEAVKHLAGHHSAIPIVDEATPKPGTTPGTSRSAPGTHGRHP